MQNKVPISDNEVKRMFVLAHAFKEKLRDITDVYNYKLNESDFVEVYERFQEELSQADIDEFILNRDSIRHKRYENMVWYKEDKNFSDAGVWPKMQSIDIELTKKSALETAEGVQDVLSGRSKLIVPRRFRRKVESIREHSDFLYSRFIPIFFPGGEVREKDYNVWARENNEPLCDILDHDIDDGNSRIVSYALDGVKNMPVYVGEYKD